MTDAGRSPNRGFPASGVAIVSGRQVTGERDRYRNGGVMFGLGRKRRIDQAVAELGAQVGDARTRPPFGSFTSPLTGAETPLEEWLTLTHRGCEVLAYGYESEGGSYPPSAASPQCVVQVRTPWLPETRVLPYTPQFQQLYEKLLRVDMPMFVPEHAPHIMVYSADTQRARAVLTPGFLSAIDHGRRPKPKIIAPFLFADGVLSHQIHGRLDPPKALGIADGLIDLLALIPGDAWPGGPR